ncbi:Membrane protein involved in the export of O-antigen and teichoic acid [Frankineae bacterium MT45]|nr:Membrane protein involved in the export of O-antigen and teichoic acid [Frankineae bacterium MT45]
MSRANRIVGAVGVQLLGRLLGTVASIFTVAVTTRYLSVDDYGLLTAATVYIALWASFTELGIGGVIVRKVTGEEGDLATLVRVNLGLSLIYCLPLLGVCATVGWAIYHGQDPLPLLILIVGGGLVLSTISSCLHPVFLASVRFRAVASADAICRVASLLATLLVVHLHGGLLWIGVVQVVPPLVQLLIFVGAAARQITLTPIFARRASIDLLRESLPITAVGIIGVLYWRIDGLILSLLSTHAEIAAYGLAYTIAFNLSVLSAFFLASSLSTMTEQYAHDVGAFAAFVSRSAELLLFLATPIVVFGGLVAGRVVALLAAPEFVSISTQPLRILLVAVALTFFTGLLGQALFAAHDQRFLLRLNVVNLGVNILLNLVLIPSHGAVGAGVALVASELSGVLIASWRLRGLTGYRFGWLFLTRLTPAVGCGVVVWWLTTELNVLIAILLISAAYFGANLLFGPVRLATVRSLLGRSPAPAIEPTVPSQPAT